MINLYFNAMSNIKHAGLMIGLDIFKKSFMTLDLIVSAFDKMKFKPAEMKKKTFRRKSQKLNLYFNSY